MSTTNKPQHCKSLFSHVDNEIVIGGLPISDVVKSVGQTPFYAYDKKIIESKINYLKKVLPAEIELHYAMKANPMPEVVNFIAKKVDGLDVASGNELIIATQSNTRPKDISFAGPGKSDTELQQAITSGITINVESKNELLRVINISKQLNKTADIAIRVNPDFELKTSGMKMSGGPKQFGIDAEYIPQLTPLINNKSLHFRGFHIFSGSQNLSENALIEAQNKTIDLAIALANELSLPIECLNIGGGFGIPYFPGEERIDLHIIAENLKRIVEKSKTCLPGAQLIIELGRFIVGEAGIYVCKIIDKKVSRGHVFLITDGGLHHHLAASGNFGQVIRKNYPVVIANKISSKETEHVSIVGPLCTPLDLLANNMELPAAQIGNLVGVLQSGAYGFTASPINFLSHPHPVEVLL